MAVLLKAESEALRSELGEREEADSMAEEEGSHSISEEKQVI